MTEYQYGVFWDDMEDVEWLTSAEQAEFSIVWWAENGHGETFGVLVRRLVGEVEVV